MWLELPNGNFISLQYVVSIEIEGFRVKINSFEHKYQVKYIMVNNDIHLGKIYDSKEEAINAIRGLFDFFAAVNVTNNKEQTKEGEENDNRDNNK